MLVSRKGDRAFQPVGVDGVEFCGLRMNDTDGGAAVISMKKGARFPTHTHKSDEQTLILSGVAVIGGERLGEGDYLFTESGEHHDVVAEEDVVMYVTVEKGIEITEG